MGKLIYNELFKLFQRKAPYYMIGSIILLVLLSGTIGKFTENPATDSVNWKEELKVENEALIDESEEFNHNSILVNNHKRTIAMNEYRVNHHIKPDKMLNVGSFTVENIPFITFVGLLVIIIASGIVSAEFNWGTIKLIMTKPVERTKFLLAQYITVIIFSLLCLVVLLGSSFGFGYLLFGPGENMVHLTYYNGAVHEENIFMYIFKSFSLSTVGLWMVVTLAFTLSALLRNTAISLALSLFVFLMGETITGLLAMKFDWVKYTLFANTDLNMYTNGSILVDGMTMPFSLMILFGHFIVFMLLAFIPYVKRDITT